MAEVAPRFEETLPIETPTTAPMPMDIPRFEDTFAVEGPLSPATQMEESLEGLTDMQRAYRPLETPVEPPSEELLPSEPPAFEDTVSVEQSMALPDEAPPTFEETQDLDLSPVVGDTQAEKEKSFMEQVGETKRQLEWGFGDVMVGGFRDAAENALKTIVDIFTEPREEPYLPEIPEPETTMGQVARSAVQFGYGMAGAGKALKPLAKFVKTGKPVLDAFIKTEGAALVGGQFALDPHEDRLSNLIESYPSLRNPVTNYLQSRPDDTDAEARLKMAIEDLGVGAALEGVMTPIRFIKQARQATEESASVAADQKPPTRQTGDDLVDQQKTQIQQQQANAGAVPQPKEEIVPDEVEIPVVNADTPVAEPVQGFAGNINLNRIDSDDSVKQALRDTSDAYDGFQPARRGVVSHEETRALADSLGMTEEQLLSRRKGQAFNAHEALAARDLMVRSGEDLVAKANRAAAEGGDEAILEFQQAMTRHAAIQEQVAGMTAEAGRALNQFNIRAQGAARNRAIRSIIEQGGGDENLRTLADAISNLDSPEQIAAASLNATKPTFLDKLQELWINGLLSGPQTHAVNMLSNQLVAMWTIPEEFLTAAIGKFRRGHGKVRFREATARAFGLVEGARDGMKLAYRTLKEGEPPDLVSKIEARKFKAIQGPAGEIIRIPSRFLSAEDQLFRSIGYRMRLNELAMKQGLDEGLSGDALANRIRDIINDPPEKISLEATKAADYQTFTNELGKGGKAIQRLTRELPMAKFIVPFIRTPLNIMKFAAERTPAAPILKEFRDAIRAGGAERDRALARLTLGTTFGAGMMSYAVEGRITGAGPDDARAKNQLRASGWQPYSIRIGDKYYAYNRLEPLGMLMGISADLAELYKNPDISQEDKSEAEKALVLSLMSIAKNLGSKTWLKGVSDFTSAMDDPERFGPRYVQSLIGSFVPTMSAQLARVQDPTLREARTITNSIQARVPGLREKLMPRLNVFGEDVVTTGGLGPDIVSPIYTSQDKFDPTINEMNRLRVFPPMVQRKINNKELSPEEYYSYAKMAGEDGKRWADQIISSPGWQRMPDDVKVQTIETIFQKARAMARLRMIAAYPKFAMRED